MANLKLYLFGPPRMEIDGQPLEIKLRKAQALIAYLAVTGKPCQRDSLASIFWPRQDMRAARASLRRLLYDINHLTDEKLLTIQRENVDLNRTHNLWLDVARFQTLLSTSRSDVPLAEPLPARETQQLIDAVDLYSNDFMAGFSLSDCPEFDDWQLFQREAISQALARGLLELVHSLEGRGKFEAAIPYARRRLALDTLHEPAHRLLMKLYANSGQQALALRQYAECARILEEELGVPPDEETQALADAIRTRRFPEESVQSRVRENELPVSKEEETSAAHATVSAAPSEPSARALKNNLPAHSVPFVGRMREREEICYKLLDPACRILTLVGPGGLGKTRLAAAVAESLVGWHNNPPEPTATIPALSGKTPGEAIESKFADGLHFISLASVHDTNSMVAAIADAVEYSFSGDSSSAEQLLNFLRRKSLLLILDNFEHLLDCVDFVMQIYRTAPHVTLLITSREALSLYEEWFHPLAGLATPSSRRLPHEALGLESSGTGEWQALAMECDSVQLFAQAARRARHDFDLESELNAVIQICQLVDGVPLALELAAAWLKVIPCDQICGEIAKSLDILTSQQRNIPARHRSMRAVLEQSWQMLDPQEQSLFQKMTVFQNGFVADAVQKVTDASLMTLASLADKSFVRLQGNRYQIHELLRQFAAEKAPRGALDDTALRHRQYYLALMNRQAAVLLGPNPLRGTSELRPELDNIRQAWHSAVADHDLALLIDAVDALADVYEYMGLAAEATAVFSTAAAELEKQSPTQEVVGLLCRLYGYVVTFDLNTAPPAALHRHEARALELYAQCNDPLGRAAVSHMLCRRAIYSLIGNHEHAMQKGEEALALYRAHGSWYKVVSTLFIIGEAQARIKQIEAARRSLQEALDISLRHESTRCQAIALSHLGVFYYHAEDLREAYNHFTQAFDLFIQIRDLTRMSMTANNVAWTLLCLGDFEEALAVALKAAEWQEQIYNKMLHEELSDTLGRIYLAMADTERARATWEQAVEMTYQNDQVEYRAFFLAGLAEADIADGKLEHAQSNLRNAVDLLEENSRPDIRIKVLQAKARLHEKLGEPHRSLDILKQALEILESYNDRLVRCEILVEQGTVLYKLGESRAANRVIQEGLQLAKALGRRQIVEDAQSLILQVQA